MASRIIVPFRPLQEESDADVMSRARIVKTLVTICRELEKAMVTENEKKACREVEGWLRQLPAKTPTGTARKSVRRKRSSGRR